MSEGGKSVSAYMGDEAPERLYGEFRSNFVAERQFDVSTWVTVGPPAYGYP